MVFSLTTHSGHCAQHLRRQHCSSLLLRQQQQLQHVHQPGTSASAPCRLDTRTAAAIDELDIRHLDLPAAARLAPEADPVTVGSAAALHIPPVEDWGQDAFLMSGCEPQAAPLRVAVLVSGGVDSSLALKLVTAAGHQATAFYLKIWFQEDFRNFWDACPWEQDLSYAQQVCDALGVPLVVVPLTQQYWDRVVSHSVAEIKGGRTPNPDMLCNSRVKFGAFVEYLQQQHAGSFDRIVSGHYAKIQRSPPAPPIAASGPPQQQQQQHAPYSIHSSSAHSSNGAAAGCTAATEAVVGLLERKASHAQASSSSSGSSRGRAQLLMVPDAVKDQTYFLANLSPQQLDTCMFPLGSFTKPQVRALAAAAGLATSGRKDSQGICFLGKVKFGEFVGEHLGTWPGPLVEEDTGQVVGVHDGYWFYTVGQRGGIKLPGGPWYVTRKDMAGNVVYVSRTYYEQERRRDAFVAGPFNWLVDSLPQPDTPLRVKVRHGPHMYECSLTLSSKAGAMAVLQQGTAMAFQPAETSSSSSSSSSRVDSNSSSRVNSSSSSRSGPELAGSAGDGVGAAGLCEPLYGLVLLSGNDQGLAPGQYAVFYQGQQCLGCAQILGSVASTPAAAAAV